MQATLHARHYRIPPDLNETMSSAARWRAATWRVLRLRARQAVRRALQRAEQVLPRSPMRGAH